MPSFKEVVYPCCIVSYYIKWVTTSWAYSKAKCRNLHGCLRSRSPLVWAVKIPFSKNVDRISPPSELRLMSL